MTSLTDSVSLAQVLGAQAGGRLPLSTALYACSELARLVATEHEMGRTFTGLDADHIRCTKSGGVVLGGSRVHHPDARADVQAVGAVFYRLLTGKAPAPRDVVAPSHFNPGVDAELDAVVLAALAPNPAQRPASLRVLESALTAVFEELELSPSPDELAALVKATPRRAPVTPPPAPVVVAKQKPVIQRSPPSGWYADQTIDDGEDEDEPTLSAASEVPSWQAQERERKWMVGITAALVVAALLWALWPAPKQNRAALDDTPARISAR